MKYTWTYSFLIFILSIICLQQVDAQTRLRIRAHQIQTINDSDDVPGDIEGLGGADGSNDEPTWRFDMSANYNVNGNNFNLGSVTNACIHYNNKERNNWYNTSSNTVTVDGTLYDEVYIDNYACSGWEDIYFDFSGIEGWEDDGGDRCIYDSGDDDYDGNNTIYLYNLGTSYNSSTINQGNWVTLPVVQSEPADRFKFRFQFRVDDDHEPALSSVTKSSTSNDTGNNIGANSFCAGVDIVNLDAANFNTEAWTSAPDYQWYIKYGTGSWQFLSNSGSTPSYSFLASHPGGSTPTNVQFGVQYSGNTCDSDIISNNITYQIFPEPLTNAQVNINVEHPQCDDDLYGNITVTLNGLNVANYWYGIFETSSGVPAMIGNPNPTNGIFTGVFPGTHIVLIRPSGGGCYYISDPIVVDSPPDPITITLNSATAPICTDGNDGSLTVGYTGGNSFFDMELFYPSSGQWQTEGLNQTGSTFTFDGLTSGSGYRVRVTDINGCEGILENLTVPVTTQAQVTINNIAVDDDCYIPADGIPKGKITVTAADGYPPYSYTLIDPVNGNTTNTTGIFEGLAPNAMYRVEVTDDEACTFESLDIMVGTQQAFQVTPSFIEGPACPQNSIADFLDKTGRVNFGIPFNSGYQTSIDGGQNFDVFIVQTLNEGLNQLLVIDPDGCLSDTLEFQSVSPPNMTLVLDSLESARAVPFESSFYQGPEPVDYSADQSYERRAIAHLNATGGTGSYSFTFQPQSWGPDPENPNDTWGYYFLDNDITQQTQKTWGNANTYRVVTSPLSQQFDFNENYLIQYRDSEGCKSPYFYITPDSLYETPAWDVSYNGWGGVYAPDSVTYNYNDYLQYVVPGSYYCEGVTDTTQLLDTTYVIQNPPPVVDYSQWRDTICPGETFTITIPNPEQEFIPTAAHLDTFEYSMDMGMTWQDSPTFTVTEGDYFPMVRSKRTGVTRKYVVAGDDIYVARLETVICDDNGFLFPTDVPNFTVDLSTADPICAYDDFAFYCNGATILGYPGVLLDLRNYYYTFVPTRYDTTLTGIPENIPADNIPIQQYPWDSLPIAAQEYHNSLNVPPVVIVGSDPMMATAVSTSGGCSGGASASIVVSMTGGRPPFSYSLDNMNFQADSIFSGVADGNYTVYVSDTLGCDTVSININVNSTVFALQILSQADASCFGADDGSISFIPIISGSETYQYSIDNGMTYQNSTDFTGLAPGNYTGVILGDQGCTDTITNIIINEPMELVVNGSITNPILCHGDNSGIITASANGSSTYQYSIDNGLFGNSPIFDNLTASTYIIEVLDIQTGCIASTMVNIPEPDALTLEIASSTDLSCAGANDGAVTLSAGGGTGTYEYSNDNGATYQTSNLFNNLGPTNIFIVRDANNCTFALPFDLNEPQGLVLSLTSDDGTCNNDGSIASNVTGGTAPLNYLWSNNETTADISGLDGGTYTLTITDANGCTVSEQSIINALGIDLIVTGTTCGNASSGQIEINILAGTAPFTYSIDNGNTTQNTSVFSNLTAGNYDVVVTDNSGCSVTTMTTIIPNPAMQLSIANESDISCNGAMDGMVEISVMDGQAPYLYSANGSSFQGNPVFNNLDVMNGYFYVQDDNGCLDSILVDITEPNALSLTLNPSSTDCTNPIGGIITSIVSGGTPPYNYLWSNTATTPDINNLSAGSYTLTVTDANACEIIMTASTSVMTVTANETNPTCFNGNDGSIILSAMDGVAPYNYSIDNGATFQANPDFTNLSAGIYDMVVEDANLCVFNLSVTLTEPIPVGVNIINITDPSCFGVNDGSIEISGVDGQAPYQYSQDGVSYSISGLFGNLTAGDYTFFIQDNNGCISQTNPITLGEPAELTVNLNTSTTDCTIANSGFINSTISGGTVPFTYNWSNGGTTDNINNLSANTYTLTVTDANGCTASSSADTPIELTAGFSLDEPSCNSGNNGSISITPSGGQAPYSYSIDNGATSQANTLFENLTSGNYTIQITDNAGCVLNQTVTLNEPVLLDAVLVNSQGPNCQGGTNGNIEIQGMGGTPPYQYSLDGMSYSFSGLFQNIGAGTYTFFIQDGNDCTTQSNPIVLNEPDAIIINLTEVSPESCQLSNGIIASDVMGGTAPYSYEWDGNASLDNDTLYNATAGSHTLLITDANGCQNSMSLTLSGNNDVPQITLVQNQNSNCGLADGTLEVSAGNSTAPYTFAWSHDNTLMAGLAQNLLAGSYTVTVTDGNGCESSTSYSVNDNGTLSIFAEATGEDACGLSIGTASVSVLAGSAPYTYNWDNGDIGTNATGLAVGTHFVTVTDDTGCQAIGTVDIVETPDLMMTGNVIFPSCSDTNDGEINISVTGGTMPLAYTWDAPGNPITEDISNLSSGIYNATVTDANGCSITNTFDLQITPVTINTLQVVQPLCGNATGAISIEGQGGTSPYSYEWSDMSMVSSISALDVGTYTVTVTDANGCSQTETFILGADDIIIDLVNSIQPNCGNADGSITLTVAGGAMPYTYAWSNLADTPSIDNLAAGTYTLTVTDANGCEAMFSTDLISVEATIGLINLTDANCGAADGQIEVEAGSGTAPFNYAWSGGTPADGLNTGLVAGTYTVTITDAVGCSAVETYTIDGTALGINIVQELAPTCIQPEGFLEVEGIDGTPPFSYAWSNGGSDAENSGLTAGTYTVTVSDAAGCNQTVAFDLEAVEDISIELGGPDTTICGGTSLILDAGDAPDSFVWEDNTGILGNMETLEIIEGGTYWVEGTSPSGCTDSDTITVSISNDILSANFLMASEAVAGDTVIAVEVSFPMPDTVYWFFDDNDVEYVKDTLNQRWFHFPDVGTYTIGMEANNGTCIDYIEKQITIVADSTQLTGQVAGFSEILNFILYPNPSDGQFTVEVELSNPQPVALRLYDMDSNPIDFRESDAASDYLFNYNLPNLNAGGYVLLLQTPTETRHINLIILN